MTIPYDAKFRREKILANLVNCKRCTKLFLSKSFLPLNVGIQLASQLTFASKVNSILSFQKLTANSIEWIAVSQLASETLIKLFSHFYYTMFQPVGNQQDLINSSQPQIKLLITDAKLLQVFAISNYKSFPPIVPQLVSYIVVLCSLTIFLYKAFNIAQYKQVGVRPLCQ